MKILATVDKADNWFDPNALYAAKNLLPKNERLYYISPDNFLLLALRLKNVGGSSKKRGNLNTLVEKRKKFDQLPYLRLKEHVLVDEDLGITRSKKIAKVFGHEGRHRNFTLKELGYNKIPVIVKFQEMDTIPEYVINQDGNKKVKFSNVFKPFK